VGSLHLSHVSWRRPGGAALLDDVTFSVGDRSHTALVGANGTGKTTLLRLITGELSPTSGTVRIDGQLGFMPQLVGSIRDATTVRDLLVQLSPARIRAAHERLAKAEARSSDDPMAYANALAAWGDAGGYEAEVWWDECCMRATGYSLDHAQSRALATFSGGEQKRIAIEALLRGEHDVLLLDEPDNFLDVPGKRWLEEQLNASQKTILFVSHDRELLAAAATSIVTVEGKGTWTHGGGFATYHAAKAAEHERRDKDRSLYEAERKRLEELVAEMRRRAKISDTFAPRLKAAESRLRQFEERSSPPVVVKDQKITVRLHGARTGKRAVMVEGLALHGLTDAFDAELWYGERVAVLGGNGAGKSHFLRLLAGDHGVKHDGSVRLGAGVVPGHFSQTHNHPEWSGRTLLEILHDHDVVRGPAIAMLRRYELDPCAEQWFETLSGGQQARFQILLLELSGATLLLLDEPTDNLDLVSAEALEFGLVSFQGTVIAVTHDRWFLRGFDRFLVFEDDCSVSDLPEPPAVFRSA
jgi:ATPase subunit of ABC transporter with duplicated ATPase domains